MQKLTETDRLHPTHKLTLCYCAFPTPKRRQMVTIVELVAAHEPDIFLLEVGEDQIRDKRRVNI